MPQVINTNVASLNSQRSLNMSQTSLATSLQRLSSGLRINSAKDDAAGLAIAERMTSQIRGLNQAARNANDGISLAQTAEGALGAVTENLQRIRELSVQAANATNSASDRAALNAEASQLVAEIDRVATTTQFNGVNLLDGTFTSQNFQVGASANQTIQINSIASARSSALGVGSGSSYSTTSAGAEVGATALLANALSINGHMVGAAASDGVSNTTPSASGIAVAAAINAISGDTGVTATVGTTSVAGTAATGFATAIVSGDITINGVNIGAIAAAGNAAARGGQVAAAVNAVSAQTGVTASFNTTTGAVALSAADGRNITVVAAATAGANDVTTGITAGAAAGAGATDTTRSAVSLSSTSSAGITIAGNTAAGLAASGLTAGYTAATATVGAGVSSVDLTTTGGATSALAIIDAALATVNSSRASLGAYQNRFSSTVSNLQTTSENLSASRSRIQDADFAVETANMTRAQILQQAGTAMLAQANALPQNVLSLLRG
ncbi:flagellin [Accumulibacter sp.]|uniref:flagellin N-terminal helical domain-containing protein n=1 Tax=Accumulibacter sp. TaxID=2053492 RepID=UPI001A5DF0AA|nr:flagellin [Accumulibacter sp.]MBL8373706.1 flagellin [Accumulibacter sp.]